MACSATGWSVALRDVAERTAGGVASGSWQTAATVLVFVVLLTLLNEVAGLPLAFYSGFYLERQYGLRGSAGRLALDQAKSLGLGLLLGAARGEPLRGDPVVAGADGG